MKIKQILKMAAYMIVGGIVGASVTLGMLKLSEGDLFRQLDGLSSTLSANAVYIQLAFILLLFIPAVLSTQKGKSITKSLQNATDEEIDRKQVDADNFINVGLTLAQVFMVLNFMVLGLLFNPDNTNVFIVIVIFMLSTIGTSFHEIITIKFIQKYDKRIKGDPTSLKFGKDFLGSLDEAEQLLVFKSGYKAFQTSRGGAMVLIIILILVKFVFETGNTAIFTMGVMMIIQSVSYYIHSRKLTKGKVAIN